MIDELIDQVDKNDNIIGTVLKSKAHKDIKILHREAGMVVFNDKNEVLLQQRAFSKKNDPGGWKNACGGHIGAGEDPKKAAARELFEELGVKAEPLFFKKYFKKHQKKGENQESRFIWIFYSVVSGRPKLKIDKIEVNDAKWIKIEDLKIFAKNNDYDIDGFSQEIIMEIYKTL